MLRTTATAVLALAGFAMAAGTALAAEHEVRMLNRGAGGEAMVFEPALLQVAPGDTVRFVAEDAGHNTEIIAGMLPDGAEGWKGAFNEEVVVTFTEEGVYGYKCLPHYGMGMVGVIVVGETAANAVDAAAVNHPGRAAQRMAELLAAVGEAPVQLGDAAAAR